jgi:antitoxin component YwqK of YwqJK toxin-antitoxin module
MKNIGLTKYTIRKYSNYNYYLQRKKQTLHSEFYNININDITLSREYYQNGFIKSQINFCKGSIYEGYSIYHGKTIEYYDNGNISLIKNYFNDKLCGKYLEYYDNKNIKTIGNYKNGLRYGQFKNYYSNGNISEILYYGDNENLCNQYIKYNNINMIELKIIYNPDYSINKRIVLVSIDVNAREYIVYDNNNNIIQSFPYYNGINLEYKLE